MTAAVRQVPTPAAQQAHGPGDAWHRHRAAAGAVVVSARRSFGLRKNAKPGTSVLLTTATNTSPTLTPWSHGSAAPIACHCLLTTASVDSPDHASGQPPCQLNPKFLRESHDPQIEKAIDVVMGQLKKDARELRQAP